MDETQVIDPAMMAKNATGSGLDAETLTGLHRRMLREQGRYISEMEHLDREVAEGSDDLVPERGGLSNHIADDADEVTEQEKDIALRRNSETLLDLVNLALDKMQNGTYGSCEVCGKPIGERLEARPYARYCIIHQEQAELRDRLQANAQPEYTAPRTSSGMDEE